MVEKWTIYIYIYMQDCGVEAVSSFYLRYIYIYTNLY